jgi:hypothetical protein
MVYFQIMFEARPYNPANTQPTEFMRPATEPFQGGIAALTRQTAERIREKATERYVALFGEDTLDASTAPDVRVGSEVELLVFSPKSDPHKDIHKLDVENPNYSLKHRRKVRKLAESIVKPPERGGLDGIVHEEVDRDRIFMETRITPSTAEEFEDKAEIFQAWIQYMGIEDNIHPVVHSQHYHISITSADGEVNILEDPDTMAAVQAGVTDIYHRAFPFVRLPEHILMGYSRFIGLEKGVKTKGDENNPDNPLRLEARANASEYAFDPHLNLFIALTGVERGLNHIGRINEIDTDFPMDRADIYSYSGSRKFSMPYFSSGGYIHTYENALDHVLVDPVLDQAMPRELLVGIHEVVQSYIDIAERRTTVEEVRERTARKMHV